MDHLTEKYSGYYEYFDDIWRRVHGLVLAFIVFFIVGFLGSGTILRFIIAKFNLDSATIVTTSPFQFFDLAMTIGMYAGFIVCLPLFLYHTYEFIKGGLSRKEKKFFFVLLPIGFALFCLGFGYGAIVLDLTLNSIAALNMGLGLSNFWDISVFLSQIVFTATLLGILFQFPLVLTFMIRAGVMDVGFLKDKRRHAVVAMFIVTAALPPSDGFSLLVMVLPMLVIYEITIWVNSLYLPRPFASLEPV